MKRCWNRKTESGRLQKYLCDGTVGDSEQSYHICNIKLPGIFGFPVVLVYGILFDFYLNLFPHIIFFQNGMYLFRRCDDIGEGTVMIGKIDDRG